MDPIPLGPWPLGADNVHKEKDDVFQLSDGVPNRLIVAENVDLSAAGWPTLRQGVTERLTGTAYKRGGGSYCGLLLLQDGGSIYRVTPGSPYTRSELVSGLSDSAVVQFHEWAGQVFWTNGLVNGRILADGTALPWGLGVAPSPTLGTTAGDLPAGRYRVAATLVNAADQDRAGNTIATEGGATKAAVVSVNGAQDITATLTPGDSNATHVNFYISEANQEEMYFTQQVAVGSLPATLTNERYSKRPLRTQHMRGPIPGDGLASILGFMFTFRDNWLFRSNGLTYNLFLPRDKIFGFPWDIRCVVGLETGFYVACEKGLHWVTANGEPRNWAKEQKDDRAYTDGGIALPGDTFKSLQISAKVAVLGSEDGLIIGLPGGVIIPATDERLALDGAVTEAAFVYRKTGDIRQILMLLG